MDRSTADILEQLRQAGAFMPGTLPPSSMGFASLDDNISILRAQGPTPGIPLQQTPGPDHYPHGRRQHASSPAGSTVDFMRETGMPIIGRSS